MAKKNKKKRGTRGGAWYSKKKIYKETMETQGGWDGKGVKSKRLDETRQIRKSLKVNNQGEGSYWVQGAGKP